MKIIKLSNNKFSIVDDDNYDEISKYKWCIIAAGYAGRKIGKETILLHRIINNTPENYFTDHINGDKLDNRKKNLRSCTREENQRNRFKSKHAICKYKGVCETLTTKYPFKASIAKNKKTYYLGRFLTQEDAARAYNVKANELFGEFAKLNTI